MRNYCIFNLTLGLGALAISSCAEPTPAPSALHVIGGSSDFSPVAKHVVAITSDQPLPGEGSALQPQGSAFCTGVIIGTRTILTAAHCLQEFNPSSFAKLKLFYDDAESFLVFFGNDVGGEGITIKAAAVYPHPEWMPEYSQMTLPPRPSNDIGVIILASAIPASYEAAKIAATSPAELDQSDLFLAGYGVTRTARQDDSGTFRWLKAPFQKYQPDGKQYVVGEYGKGACVGDSGGPLFAKSSGEQNSSYVLLGTASASASIGLRCIGMRSNYVDIVPLLAWIKSIQEAEGVL